MNIYSGKCLQGICGIKAPFKDANGKELFVGDIVLIYHIEHGKVEEFSTDGLSAVVNDRYTTGSFEGILEHRDSGKDDIFVMGIKSCKISRGDEDIEEGWLVVRIKSWKNVVDGENWKDYGFNYHKEELQILKEGER